MHLHQATTHCPAAFDDRRVDVAVEALRRRAESPLLQSDHAERVHGYRRRRRRRLVLGAKARKSPARMGRGEPARRAYRTTSAAAISLILEDSARQGGLLGATAPAATIKPCETSCTAIIEPSRRGRLLGRTVLRFSAGASGQGEVRSRRGVRSRILLDGICRSRSHPTCRRLIALCYNPTMRNEFTAIIEAGDNGWWVASSPEVPAAIGQGRTPDEAREDLAAAIMLVLDHVREEAAKASSPSALKQTVTVG